MSDPDKNNRAIREAIARWAHLRGLGFSQRWNDAAQIWEIEINNIAVRVDVNGTARIDGRSGRATSDKGITQLLNRVEREALR